MVSFILSAWHNLTTTYNYNIEHDNLTTQIYLPILMIINEQQEVFNNNKVSKSALGRILSGD